MEENKDIQDVDLENNDSDEGSEEGTQQEPDLAQKVKEQESEIAKWKRIASKAKKEREATKDDTQEPEPEDKPEGELDYGEKAYLRSALNIKGADEIQLARDWKKKYGSSVEEMETDEVFLSRLTNLREARETGAAVPKGQRRSTQTAVTDVDIAIAKYRDTGELPTDFALRNKVVDAITAEEQGPMFQGPIVVK